MRLSYSQLSKYQLCPKSYEFYYKKNLKPETKSGALAFGSALDVALNSLMIERDLDKAKEIFLQNFLKTDINGVIHDLKTSDKIVYSVSDFSEELLSDGDLEELKSEPFQFKTLKERRDAVGWDGMSKEEKLSYNKYNFLAMRRKGLLMLEAYARDILPKIKRVVEVQKRIELHSSNNKDSIVGYIDAIVELEGVDGLVIMDNKTSSMPYDQESVFTSQQLSLYSFILQQMNIQASFGAYAVLLKPIRKKLSRVCKTCGNVPEPESRHKTCNATNEKGKRCGGEWDTTKEIYIDTQLIVDRINENFTESVIENLDVITESISKDLYPRNFQSCQNYWGGKCDYFNLCYKKAIDK